MNVAVAMDARVQVRAGKVADEVSADPRKAKHPENRDAPIIKDRWSETPEKCPKRVERFYQKRNVFSSDSQSSFCEWVFIFPIFADFRTLRTDCALTHRLQLTFFGRERDDEKRNRATTNDGVSDPRRAETPGVKAEKNHRASLPGRARGVRDVLARWMPAGESRRFCRYGRKKPLAAGASRRHARGARDRAARAEVDPR